MIIMVTIEIVEPGPAVASILDCLCRRYEDLDPIGDGRYQVRLLRTYATHEGAVEEIETALDRCDESWRDCIAVVPA
jgi:hypothetical protein